jgi:quercetin dioxygenase-like cupin family protein
VGSEGSGWKALALDEVEPVHWQRTELVWRPVRGALGTHIVGMGAYTAERAGQVVIGGHTESEDGLGHEEVYVVLRGRATFTLDGQELDAPAGTFVAVIDPGVHRRAVAADPDTAILALGGPPVFTPSDSEWIERARPHLRSDPERAIAILEELRTARPEGPVAEVAATFLAIARRDDAGARAALARLVARRPDLLPVLADDEDLEGLLD